MNDQWVQQLKC